MVQESKSPFSPSVFKNYVTAIRPWSCKLQQADQHLSPTCYAKFKIWDLKNYFKQSFLESSEDLVTHFKGNLWAFVWAWISSTWIYITFSAFLFTGQLSGIFWGNLFQQKILKLNLLWLSFILWLLVFALFLNKILISSVFQFLQVLKLTFFFIANMAFQLYLHNDKKSLSLELRAW